MKSKEINFYQNAEKRQENVNNSNVSHCVLVVDLSQVVHTVNVNGQLIPMVIYSFNPLKYWESDYFTMQNPTKKIDTGKYACIQKQKYPLMFDIQKKQQAF